MRGEGSGVASGPVIPDGVEQITAGWMQQALAEGGMADVPVIEDIAHHWGDFVA